MAERLSVEALKANLGNVPQVTPAQTRPAFRKALATERPKSEVVNQPPPATEPMKKLLRDMLAERQGIAEAEAIRAEVNRAIAAHPGKPLSFKVVRNAIDGLKAIPRPATVPSAKPTFTPRPNKYPGKCEECGYIVPAGAGILSKTDAGGWEVEHAEGGCPISDFPFPFSGYALEVGDEVKFYVVNADGIFAQASSDLWPLTVGAAEVVDAIAVDPKAAAALYGRELGECGRCHRTLTSEWRKLGIGPVCNGKEW